MYKSINPANNELIKEYQTFSGNLDSILELTSRAQKSWNKVAFDKKINIILAFKDLVIKNQENLAKLISLEMGKAYKISLAEIDRVKQFCDYIVEHAEGVLQSKLIPAQGAKAVIKPEALGIIFSITPWNVPIGTPIRHILPAIISGNALILKPAPNVAGCAFEICRLLYQAGVPEDLVKTLLLDNKQAEELIAHPLIRKVTFVGSTAVGRRLAAISGQNIKPILLELGGSDPFIILKSADLDKAAEDAASTRMINSGQVCCSPKRFIIEEDIYDTFKAKFIASLSSKKMGDPLNPETDFGPLARKDITENLVAQVDAAIKAGGKIILSGGRVDQSNFFKPIIIEMQDSTFDEEFFGPVCLLYKVQNSEEAVKLANSSQYGLGATIYSNTQSEIDILSSSIESGFIYINSRPGLNPYVPFGGIKNSGFGKDCGEAGIIELINSKAIISNIN